MAGNTVVVSILGNAKSLQGALGQSESSLAKFGKVAGAVAVAAAAAIGAIGVKATRSASELEQALGGMEAIFKDSSRQMLAWANDAADSVGLAKSEYASLSTILGAQLKNMGLNTEQLADQTNELVGVGADLAAQFGGSTSDAVSALSSLLRGERDPIERYGVSINEAAVKAKMAEMGLAGLTGEAEKNAKLQATLALLYQQTADAQGAFARESATLAGQQQRLGANFENLYATLGTELLPAVTAITRAFNALLEKVSNSAAFETLLTWINSASTAFASFINDMLDGAGTLDFSTMFQGVLDGAVNGITKAADWLATGGASTLVNRFVEGRSALFDAAFKVFPAILDALVKSIPAIVTGLLALVTQLALMLQQQAPIILAGAVQLFTGLITALTTILPGILTMLAGLLPVIIEALLGMIPALLETAISLFTALVEAIPLIVPPLLTAIITLLPGLIETVLGMIPAILDAAVQLFTALVESLPIILPLLITAIIDLLPKIVTTVISMLPRLLTAAVQLFTGIVTAIPKILPELIPALVGLLPEIVGALLGMIPDLIKAGIDLIGGLVSGLWQAAGAVGEALLGIIKGAVGGFLAFLGIKSPSRVFAGYGKNVVQGLVKGLDASESLVDRAMGGLSSAVTSGFNAELTAPDLAFSAHQGAGSAPTGNVYNIEVHTLNPTAETGRIIVQSIRDYELAGGRL